MSAVLRLYVTCVSFSVLVVDCSRRAVDPGTSSPTPLPTTSSESDEARCVNITSSLASCRRLGYRQMRLPNLLNDTASTTSAATLIDSCGEDGMVLMCSLMAPVCIDRPIWPCASLCRNVSSTCMDVAALIDCSKLPSDDQLCIGPNSTSKKVSYDAQFEFDVRLQRPHRKRPGRLVATDNDRRNWKARRASPRRRTKKPSTRRTRKWDVNYRDENINSRPIYETGSEAGNTTAMTSCSICVDQLSRSGLTERLCDADFVAKVRPSRFIRAGASLKLLASKSTKFYKTPKLLGSLLGSLSRRRVVFFLHGVSAAQCPCLQAASGVDGLPRGRRAGGGEKDDGSLLVGGRLDEVDGRRRRTRLVVTAVVPVSSQALVRRALRLTRNDDVCVRRTTRTDRRRSRPAGTRRRRPDQTDGEQSDEQVVPSGGRYDGRKRTRLRKQSTDGSRRSLSRKSKSQRKRRGRRQRLQTN